MCLNPFIIECHEKFKSFFVACCNVQEPEVQVLGVQELLEEMLLLKVGLQQSLP